MRVRWRARRNSTTIIYDDGDVSICGGVVEHFLCARSVDMLLRSFLVYHQVFMSSLIYTRKVARITIIYFQSSRFKLESLK